MHDRWSLATVAAAAFAVNPEGLQGLVLQDRPGPVRDAFLDLLTTLFELPVKRIPSSIDGSALSGGVDLVATIRTGHRVGTTDVLTRSRNALVLVPMAERMPPERAARIANAMDAGRAPPLVLLDESAEPDEVVPGALSDRMALAVSLDGLARLDIAPPVYGAETVKTAREASADSVSDGDAPEVILQLASTMGIGSLRAPLLALRLARTLAALDGETIVGEKHIAVAAALCLAPRATRLPAPPDDIAEDTPPPANPADEGQAQSQEQGPMEDRVLEAVAAMLPNLGLNAARQRGGAAQTGAGDRKRSFSDGRPVRPRPGKPEGKRLDVFATLVTAAPWQPMRSRAQPDRRGLIVVPDDFRVKQYERPSESVLIFLVDASGSQAAARMAEAKGAVELMLAEAYRRREKVALIAFRGTGAEMILPPTRSLLQAKRRLAVLPGGGPTPLASGLNAGRDLAMRLRRRGATPFLIVLTDGRGNIGLDGQPGRARAAEDSELAARSIASEGFTSVLIDTANRPQADAQKLANTMGGRYLTLPRADSRRISRMVRASVEA